MSDSPLTCWIDKYHNKLSYLLLESLEMRMQCIQLLRGRVCMIRMEPTRTDICARLRLRHSHSTKWRWQLSSFSFELQTTKNHWPLGPRRWRSHVPIKTSFKSIRICFLYLYPFWQQKVFALHYLFSSRFYSYGCLIN